MLCREILHIEIRTGFEIGVMQLQLIDKSGLAGKVF